MPPDRLSRRTYARVGLLGNPSDGFFGKVIGMTVTNFFAEVSLLWLCPLTSLDNEFIAGLRAPCTAGDNPNL